MAKIRKMLGSANSPYIISLMHLIETQSKPTLCRWCIDYVRTHYLPLYEAACPGDERPHQALAAAEAHLAGQLKFPAVKQHILAVHTAAREMEDRPAVQATARAIGQALSTLHSATHCLGMAFYGAAAAAYHQVGLTASPETYDRLAAAECANMETALQAIAVEGEPHPAKLNWNC